MINLENERAIGRIADHAVVELMRYHGLPLNAKYRQELVDRMRSAIDLAIEDEIEAIEREIPA